MAQPHSPDRTIGCHSPVLLRLARTLGIGAAILGVLALLRMERDPPPQAAAAPSVGGGTAPSAAAGSAPREAGPSTDEPARSPDMARLRFLDAGSGISFGHLEVELTPRIGVPRALFTDAIGQVDVSPGQWRIAVKRKDVELVASVVDVEAGDDRIVWLSTSVSCRVIVRSEGGHPLSDACVSLERNGDWLEHQQRCVTDHLGVCEVPAVPLAFDGRVLAWKVGFLPAQVPLAAIDPASLELEVVLVADPAATPFTIECIDEFDQPVDGVAVHVRQNLHGGRCIWLGTTGTDGKLDVGSLAGQLPGELWLSGSVLTSRMALESTALAPSVKLRVSVPVPGTLALASRSARPGERLDVRVVDATVEPAGPRLNPVGKWLVATAGGFPLDLPRNREVQITCFDEDGRSWSANYCAPNAGWRLPVEPISTTNGCRITLIGHGNDIGRVIGCVVPYFTEYSRSLVTLHVPPGPVHFEAVSAEVESARLMFSGVVQADVAIDVRFPPVQRVDFEVVDGQGQAISDLQVELRRTSHLAREPVPGTSVKQFRSSNVVRVVPGVDGRGHARLMEGSYEVWLRHLRFRDSVGSWRPQVGAALSVPGPSRFTVVCARPRQIVVAIAPEIPFPDRWQVHDQDGAFLGSQRGRVGVLWCSASHQVFEVRSAGGTQTLARLEVPAGDANARLEIRREFLVR